MPVEQPLPMMTPADCGAEPEFCRREEGAEREFSRFPSGKVLLATDGESADAFCAQKTSPRALSLVAEEDCLPFFSMPDVVAVFAAGGGELLRMARYFAEVRRIPCVLFPLEATLSGALCSRGEVSVGGVRAEVPLRTGKVIFDVGQCRDSLEEGRARILLRRLARLEQNVLAAFRGGDTMDEEDLPMGTAEETVRSAARIERSDPVGEGELLAKLLRSDGEKEPFRRACIQLGALYASFFEKGKPRRYFTPDYNARALCAGTKVREVPSAGEYALRALLLERIRARFAADTENWRAECRRTFRNRPHLPGGSRGYFRLKYLPEYGGGLSAVIRDFGLMEWEL